MLNSNNIHHEIDQVVEKAEINDYKIVLDLEAELPSGKRDLKVLLNGEVVYEGMIETGKHTVTKEAHLSPGKGILMQARTSDHVNGDKIIVTRFEINGVNMHRTNLWLLDSQKFTHDNGEVEIGNNGLYHNGAWSIELPTPVFPWMMKKKREISKNVHYVDRDNKDYQEKLDDIYYKLSSKLWNS